MVKGYKGEACSDAIREQFANGDVLSASEIFARVKACGSWKDETVWQHMMSLVVNLPPARHHWKSTKPFLFLRPDGRFEMYDERQHPRVIE